MVLCSACAFLAQSSSSAAFCTVSQYLEPLWSLATTSNLCPGETFVSAFFSLGREAEGPPGGTTFASTVTFRARLSAVAASWLFSDRYCSSLCFTSDGRSVRSEERRV